MIISVNSINCLDVRRVRIIAKTDSKSLYIRQFIRLSLYTEQLRSN